MRDGIDVKISGRQTIQTSAFGIMAKEHVLSRRIQLAHRPNIILVPIGIPRVKIKHQVVDKTI